MKQKAFTLIELLVVVAIIGILAAVGVVAYNGYTGAAKVNATKNNFNSILKYTKAELMKCELGMAEKIFENHYSYWYGRTFLLTLSCFRRKCRRSRSITNCFSQSLQI